MTRLLWRNRDSRASVNQTQKIIQHDVFLKRIRKSLYCSTGGCGDDTDMTAEVPTISSPFADYAAELFSEPHRGYSLNRLNSVTISRLNANPCSLILAIIYLERLQDVDPMYAKRVTPTELFLVSMMISTKFYSGLDEDIMYANEWAEQGSISTERIKQLELEFLSTVNWNIYVSNQIFFEKLKSIEIILARRQGLQRGWLTYTELANLIPSIAIAKTFLRFNALFTVSYAASVVTIAGAFFLASQVPGTALYTGEKTVQQIASHISSTFNRLVDRTKIPVNQTTTTTTITMESTIDNFDFSKNKQNELNQQQFERLHEEIIEDKIPAVIYMNRSVNTLTSRFIELIPKIILHKTSHTNFGINLRKFLDNDKHRSTDDDDDDDDNDDGENNERALCESYRDKYDFLFLWMTSWS